MVIHKSRMNNAEPKYHTLLLHISIFASLLYFHPYVRASACQPNHQEANNYHSSSTHHLSLVCHSCAQVLFLFRTSRHESIFVKRTTKPITIGRQQRTQEEYIQFNKYMYIYWGPGAINRNRTHNQSSGPSGTRSSRVNSKGWP